MANAVGDHAALVVAARRHRGVRHVDGGDRRVRQGAARVPDADAPRRAAFLRAERADVVRRIGRGSARYLGSAKEAADHFWKQRVTAVANLVLAVYLVWLVVSLAGFAGTMTMSAVKRDRGVSDYGTLVQGHAGVLDRIDSICFAAPVFFHITRFFFSEL